MPREAGTSRQQVLDMAHNWPMGHQPADPSRGWVPAYHFWLRTGNLCAGGIGLQLAEQIRVLEWQKVSFLILMILVAVAAIDWISTRLRFAIIGPRAIA